MYKSIKIILITLFIYTNSVLSYDYGLKRDLAVPTTTAPTVPVAPTDPTCATGIRDGSACCVAECNQCGGYACSVNPLGPKKCCSNTIIAATPSRYCNETVPPCIIVASPPAVPDPTCKTGIQNKNICCMAGCASCGGLSCSTDPLGPENCCTATIRQSIFSCENYSAPCVLNLGSTLKPTTSPEVISPTEIPSEGSTSKPTSKPTSKSTPEPTSAATSKSTESTSASPTLFDTDTVKLSTLGTVFLMMIM